MGRGCAREARDKFLGTAKLLGDLIKANGNVVQYLLNDLLAFPTKHNWWEKSDLELIKQSAAQLAEMARACHDHIFYLVRPGCGNGQLEWSDVKPAIADILPDNVVIVNYKQAGAQP